MRLRDAVVLATTKLRTHRVRSGIVTGVSGVLFGLLIGIVVIAQGVFDSAERFNSLGLGDRYIISANEVNEYYIYQDLENPEVVERVKQAHRQIVSKKQAAASKHGISYNAEVEDPSPVAFDVDSNREIVIRDFSDSEAVRLVERQLVAEHRQKSSILEDRISSYSSVTELGEHRSLQPESGALLYMKDGKEELLSSSDKVAYQRTGAIMRDDAKYLNILPKGLAESFISYSGYDPSSGELPVILPYFDAEKLLGLQPLPKSSSAEEVQARVSEVHERVGEITVEFCYRNQASTNLLNQAMQVADEIERNKNNQDYQKPDLIYAVPNETSCGEVMVVSDTRTPEEKAISDNYQAYQKEIGTHIGEPEQRKLTLRAVGLSAGYADMGQQQFSVSDLIQGLLTSSLGYGVWNMPAELLEQTPESARPEVIFNSSAEPMYAMNVSALYEFTDVEEARDFVMNTDPVVKFWAQPFGSSSLIISEMKLWFEKIMFWVVVVMGVVATIILSGLVSRTIADSRRETAVFRSIGATRGNIASIYTVYTLLFSARVAIFAFMLGLLLALTVHFVWSEQSTVGAELAFGVVNSGLDFRFIGLMSWYLPAIIGAIIVVGLISVIIPIIRNVRRNPISDMRDE